MLHCVCNRFTCSRSVAFSAILGQQRLLPAFYDLEENIGLIRVQNGFIRVMIILPVSSLLDQFGLICYDRALAQLIFAFLDPFWISSSIANEPVMDYHYPFLGYLVMD